MRGKRQQKLSTSYLNGEYSHLWASPGECEEVQTTETSPYYFRRLASLAAQRNAQRSASEIDY